MFSPADSISSSAVMDYSVSVAKKAKSLISQTNNMAMQLIEASTNVSNVSGANALARGTGTILDVTG